MNYFTATISVPLAEKLKEKGMPMEVWNRTVQGMPYIVIMEKSSFDWLDKELGNTPSEIEVRYSIPTFASCFDWMMEQGLFIVVEPHWDFANEIITKTYDSAVIKQGTIHTPTPTTEGNTWHEAAEKAIEKALTLI